MLPPTVPRLRIWGCATKGSASVMSGALRAMASLRSAARWRVIAPMRSEPPRSCTYASPGMRLRSTSTAGCESRKFIAGTRLWPPASSLAS